MSFRLEACGALALVAEAESNLKANPHESALQLDGTPHRKETTVIALSGTITVLFRDSLSLISFLSVDTIFAMYGLLSVATRRYN